MAVAANISLRRQLDDVTECPICISKFTDPRVLPCIHTYCLKCIREWFKDKRSGDKVACPLCRKDFVISEGGLDDLPKNYIVVKMMSIKELSSSEKEAQICDLCRSDDEAISTDKLATMYCLDCQHNMCAVCYFHHTKFKQTSVHKLIELREKTTEDRYPPTFCEKHKDELIKIYCFDCKEVLCMMCFVKLHKSHNCSDISKVSKKFQTEISRDLESLTELLGESKVKLNNIDIDKEQFNAKIDEMEKEVRDHAQRLHDLVERDKSKLLDELSEIRRNRVKEVESLRERIKQHSVIVGSLKTYLEQVKCKGTASDIVREANQLKMKSNEQVNVEAKLLDKLLDAFGSNGVSFHPEDSMLNAEYNYVGKITTRMTGSNAELGTPSLTHALSGTGALHTNALLYNQLFVIRKGIAKVFVYDKTSLQLHRTLAFSGLGTELTGLTTCAADKYLYVSDFSNGCIHRIDLSAGDSVTRWNVSLPRGLSVNSARNVLVTCYDTKVREYTPIGSLVREISTSNRQYLWQAVEVSSHGLLVISSCGSRMNGIFTVSLNGQVINSYGNQSGSALSQMNNPFSIAVDNDGYILVADRDNNRILVVNPSLKEARQLPLPFNTTLHSPMALSLDQSRGRLYVGEYSNPNRLLVFDNVTNIRLMFNN